MQVQRIRAQQFVLGNKFLNILNIYYNKLTFEDVLGIKYDFWLTQKCCIASKDTVEGIDKIDYFRLIHSKLKDDVKIFTFKI